MQDHSIRAVKESYGVLKTLEFESGRVHFTENAC